MTTVNKAYRLEREKLIIKSFANNPFITEGELIKVLGEGESKKGHGPRLGRLRETLKRLGISYMTPDNEKYITQAKRTKKSFTYRGMTAFTYGYLWTIEGYPASQLASEKAVKRVIDTFLNNTGIGQIRDVMKKVNQFGKKAIDRPEAIYSNKDHAA